MLKRGSIHWGGGFIFACLFTWAVSAIFCNGVMPMSWDSELGMYVRSEGAVLRWRSEGWADTRIGAHGLNASGDAVLKSRIPKFILWGDSYADGVQVDDSLRAANLFNASSQSLKAFTVANGGLSVADYYFAIPRYERLGNDIEGHVILLVGLEDVLPGHQVACHSRFLTAPLRLEESACLPSKLSLEYASLVSRFRLESLFELYRSLAKYRFRLTAMHAEERRPVPNLSKTELHRSWAFLVDSFKRQTAGFLVFVYVPIVPALERGRIVTVNPEEESKILFKRICQDSGVGFIDLSQAFKKAYAEGEHMPRGFFNAPPTGHLNADGQRLVAASLVEYFSGRTR